MSDVVCACLLAWRITASVDQGAFADCRSGAHSLLGLGRTRQQDRAPTAPHHSGRREQIKEHLPNVVPERIRFWAWVARDNKTVRPQRLITPAEENKPISYIRQSSMDDWKLYVEVGPEVADEDGSFFPSGNLTFFKFYDPETQAISYVVRAWMRACLPGHRHLTRHADNAGAWAPRSSTSTSISTRYSKRCVSSRACLTAARSSASRSSSLDKSNPFDQTRRWVHSDLVPAISSSSSSHHQRSTRISWRLLTILHQCACNSYPTPPSNTTANWTRRRASAWRLTT